VRIIIQQFNNNFPICRTKAGLDNQQLISFHSAPERNFGECERDENSEQLTHVAHFSSFICLVHQSRIRVMPSRINEMNVSRSESELIIAITLNENKSLWWRHEPLYDLAKLLRGCRGNAGMGIESSALNQRTLKNASNVFFSTQRLHTR
jgi:hypothetical protein